MIPICDLRQQHADLQDELEATFAKVAAGGHYILGPNVRALEDEIASFLGCQHAVGVNSGSDALHLALRALEIGPGDEVITTPFTFIATTEAIGLVGAKPVFVDIDRRTFNLDVTQVEDAVTSQTKAIIPVHLFGQSCEMDRLMSIAQQHDLRVIEDCAQSLGAKYKDQSTGTIGDIGCLSFFPSKNLGCLGDGGMVVSNDDELSRRVEMLRRHGGSVKYHHTELGVNSRLDELQAAILRVKLPHLNDWNERRRQVAYRYNQHLAKVMQLSRPLESNGGHCTSPSPDGGFDQSVYAQYTILSSNRDWLVEQLRGRGIGAAVYYPVPLHLQEVHQDLGHWRGDFPVAEMVAAQCLSLPIFPELAWEDQKYVADTLQQLAVESDVGRLKAG